MTGVQTCALPILALAAPVVAANGSVARARMIASRDEFRRLFPATLCYLRIVPVDEVVTLTLYYREDERLRNLLLSEREAVELDRLWDEFHFISHDALKLVDAYDQITEFATQDRPDMVIALKPLRDPIRQGAAKFRKRLVETEPHHVDAVLKFEIGRAHV